MNETRSAFEAIATTIGFVATLALGISAGAMLAEAAVLVPWWRSISPESFFSWYAANASRLFDFFGSVEIVSTVLAITAGVLYRYQRGGGALFVAAAVLALAVLIPFPLYFEQANARFAAASIAPEQLPAELARWAAWHWVRVAIGTAAFAAALLGVRTAGQSR